MPGKFLNAPGVIIESDEKLNATPILYGFEFHCRQHFSADSSCPLRASFCQECVALLDIRIQFEPEPSENLTRCTKFILLFLYLSCIRPSSVYVMLSLRQQLSFSNQLELKPFLLKLQIMDIRYLIKQGMFWVRENSTKTLR